MTTPMKIGILDVFFPESTLMPDTTPQWKLFGGIMLYERPLPECLE